MFQRKTMNFFILILRYLILIFFVLIALFPIIWLIETSLKLPKQYYASPPVWIPNPLTFYHYKLLFTTFGAIPYFKNSLIIAFANMVLVLMVSIPAAYAISRYKVGGESFSFWILTQRMLPPIAAVIPLFLLYNKIGLIDQHLSLILSYTIFNIPFVVWMLISFFNEFPVEIQEQAMVDGCTELQSLILVVLPIITPGLVVAALFCFVFSWNELMMAITFTSTNAATVTVLFASILQSPTGVWYGEASGAAVMAIVPAFVLTFFFQRYIVRGLALGGVKG